MLALVNYAVIMLTEILSQPSGKQTHIAGQSVYTIQRRLTGLLLSKSELKSGEMPVITVNSEKKKAQLTNIIHSMN
jgi:hypothetical protein